uniref:Reverse transcriptase domain-containing protein n=1 Tax=Lactuca sativa TaxID=4236 RepID=A0A9R1UF91_LACSA|nr:hypothetical protein LSAT_V11C900469590 [Lactuca sativa]
MTVGNGSDLACGDVSIKLLPRFWQIALKSEKTKKAIFLFKVNFEKAFNIINWGYLDSVMEQISFGNKWRKWICLHIAIQGVSDMSDAKENHNLS